MKDRPVSVLFVCSGNACRSQMAEALARALACQRIEAMSAGTDPRPLDPRAVAAMTDVGIDISGQQSKPLDDFRSRSFDFVISLCDRARESCVTLPSADEIIHWRIDDPASVKEPEALVLKAYRRARDDLKRRIGLFLLAHRIPRAPLNDEATRR